VESDESRTTDEVYSSSNGDGKKAGFKNKKIKTSFIGNICRIIKMSRKPINMIKGGIDND
jgi:hypothetical protein